EPDAAETLHGGRCPSDRNVPTGGHHPSDAGNVCGFVAAPWMRGRAMARGLTPMLTQASPPPTDRAQCEASTRQGRNRPQPPARRAIAIQPSATQKRLLPGKPAPTGSLTGRSGLHRRPLAWPPISRREIVTLGRHGILPFRQITADLG